MIPTHKLHHALVLAEHRSFRQAAEALNLSQPALTRSIQSLERTLGVRLFDRDRAAIELTVFGRIVVDRARETLLGLKELEQEIQLVKGLEKGVLEISLAPYPSALSGQRAVSMFLAEHPEVHCRVRVVGYADVAEDVERGRCDVGIADVGVASDKGLTTECLSRLQLYFVARPQHPLARRRRCAVEDLVRFPWASIRAPSRVAVHLPSSLGRAGRWDTETGEFVPALEDEAVSGLPALARRSDILVAATLGMVERELTDGDLVVIRSSQPWMRLEYGFISRPRRTHTPATIRFMEIVRDVEAAIDAHDEELRRRFL